MLFYSGTRALATIWGAYIFAIGMVVISPHLARLDEGSLIGLGIAIVGACIRIPARRQLGKYYNQAVAIYSDQRIVSHGLYARVAHPLYLGLAIEVCGLCVMARSIPGLVAFFGILLLIRHQIAAEERILLGQFGESYRRYRDEVW